MSSATPAEQLAQLAARYLDRYFTFYPHRAADLGLHSYDGVAPDYSPVAVQERLAEVRSFCEQAESIPTPELSPSERQDHRLLLMAAEEELFGWEDRREHAVNPMFYLEGLDVSNYVIRSYAPLDQRVKALVAHLRQVPRLLRNARAHLEPPYARPHLETAIGMYEGHIGYLVDDLPAVVRGVDDANLRDDFAEANAGAVQAIGSFVEELRAELPRAHQDFAIGPDRFRKMLRVGEMVDLPLERLLAIGEEDLRANEELLRATAARIDAQATPAEVVARLAEVHPRADELVSRTSLLLDDLRQCLIDYDIVSVPEESDLIVQETPPFLRWAFAMMSSPGPFERVAKEAYYYVTPVEPAWSEAEQEAWLRRFDYYTLRDISIHEAYPGHFIHFEHVRKVPSRVSRVFHSYSMVEGWAHYVEQVMLEVGCGGDDPRFRLAQLGEALLRNCRYVVAIRMHTGEMSLDEATRYFLDHLAMEELPARKEAVRGTFDPGYLNYTLGKLLMLKLREDYRRERGSAFHLRTFHDDCLRFGAPPVPVLRERLLAAPGEPL